TDSTRVSRVLISPPAYFVLKTYSLGASSVFSTGYGAVTGGGAAVPVGPARPAKAGPPPTAGPGTSERGPRPVRRRLRPGRVRREPGPHGGGHLLFSPQCPYIGTHAASGASSIRSGHTPPDQPGPPPAIANLSSRWANAQAKLVCVDSGAGPYARPGKQARRTPVSKPTKIVLDESRIPRNWYNVLADLPSPPPPPLHPGTLQPVGPDDLAPLFPMPLIEQEVSTERFI